MKFQLHGQKVRKTATYSKVLEHIIVKIQLTFEQPIYNVTSLREMKKKELEEQKRTRIKILAEDEQEVKDDKIFEQQTADVTFTQKWNSFKKEQEKFKEYWATS